MQRPWLKSYPDNIATSIEVKAGESLASLIGETCERYSSKIAFTCMGADLTFREFDRLAGSFASYLQNDLGLKKGDRLAIMLPNIMQFPIAMYAAAKIGVICVNTNPLYTPREMKHQFVDSGAKAIIIIDLFMDKLAEIIDQTQISHVVVTGISDQLPVWKGSLVKLVLQLKGMIPKTKVPATSFKAALALGARKSFVRPDMSLDDIAFLQYTGGTTGVSKGAMLTQRNILSNVRQIQEWARPFVARGEENVLTALPLYHIFALTVNLLSFLALGGRSILVPKPVPIENTIKIFKQYNITIMTGINTLFNALNNAEKFKSAAPQHLKIALAGGMALQSSVAKAFNDLTGVGIVEGYGLTEASPVTHCNPISHMRPENSIGVPLPSTDARIVDENGADLAIGEVGELIVRGPQVMIGYWNQPEETAKVIRNDWLFTGDMARMDAQGYFYIVDRKKDMVLVSGFNVYPNEVEAVLASYPKVLEAAVIGVPDSYSGESVKAFIVKKDDSLTEEELKAYCEKNLTAYKRPKMYSFVKELPKSNVGKILRRELRSLT